MQIQSEIPTIVAERSPLEYFHGLYIKDAAAFGGATAFCWFIDDAEAIAHLRDRLALVYLDSEGEADEVQAVAKAISTALNGVNALKAIDLDSVNATLVGLCELVWAGSLDDLRRGNEPFERDLQDDYYQNVFGDERGMGDSEWDDFAHHLTHYNG
ncbi:hypothetical protein [Luteimonas sp. MC1895]|uniref:hypothetical protein n=1 Tax=Luteimonas sp. MC1895 TaxID=2819513 RepID=UPI0018F072E1|nr:hypothetical protein [Luteimonas sp. MC1895]MBJ6978988.1 hypothetical protein [Luteimonas sp. MC1895]